MYLKKATLILIYLLASRLAHAGQSCAQVLVSHNETELAETISAPYKAKSVAQPQNSPINKISLDQEYLAAKSSKQTGYEHRVTTFLNRAFFPLIMQLTKVVKNVDRKTISQEALKVRTKFPIVEGTYRRVTGKTIINSDKVDSKITGFIDVAYHSYFGVYVGQVYSSKEDFQSQNNLHQKLLALTPNIERSEKIGSLHGWFSTAASPVGEYGRKFTEDLMITTAVLSELAVNSLAEASKKVSSDSPHLISVETGRGQMANREGITQDMAPLSSLAEGILSFHQLLVLTLSEKISGLETGTDALKAFIFNGKPDQGITSALVKRIPLAVVGPMANSGVTFKNSFVLTPNGKLEISQHLQKILAKHQEVAGKYSRPRRVCPMSLLFQGKNPFAHESHESENNKTGLQNLAEIYWQIYEVVSAP